MIHSYREAVYGHVWSPARRGTRVTDPEGITHVVTRVTSGHGLCACGEEYVTDAISEDAVIANFFQGSPAALDASVTCLGCLGEGESSRFP